MKGRREDRERRKKREKRKEREQEERSVQLGPTFPCSAPGIVCAVWKLYGVNSQGKEANAPLTRESFLPPSHLLPFLLWLSLNF